jgi:hypothetical protein
MEADLGAVGVRHADPLRHGALGNAALRVHFAVGRHERVVRAHAPAVGEQEGALPLAHQLGDVERHVPHACKGGATVVLDRGRLAVLAQDTEAALTEVYLAHQ